VFLAIAIGFLVDLVIGPASFLVPVSAQKRMAEVIIKLLNDATLREELGRYGCQWGRRNFEIKTTVKNVENIYLNLLRR
jgi:glycosyltransferase involved in cell wall biosynthesis